MIIQDVRNNLIKKLKKDFRPTEIDFIDIRLEEIADMEHFPLKELDYYVNMNPNEMYNCIFDYKEFDKNNF